ncbi:MAG: Sec-independent protein translocase protein TatB [Jatrophihabitans sp.]|uniref:Sec-independent protein translocase protein TatB n=1 Tax=Jatrophihabitans sp. TaxID=1932789 RepID=UPI003910CAE9
MFNIGPFELAVLAIVGLIVLGPDRLPGLAKDAARLLRSLRDMATGARQQLRDELGPEFADVDLRNLNPRAAVAKAVFGDDLPDLSKYDPRRLNPGNAVRDAIFGDDPAPSANGASGTGGQVSMSKGDTPTAGSEAKRRPRPKPRPTTAYDDDAT